jgi:hypothetical protein
MTALASPGPAGADVARTGSQPIRRSCDGRNPESERRAAAPGPHVGFAGEPKTAGEARGRGGDKKAFRLIEIRSKAGRRA